MTGCESGSARRWTQTAGLALAMACALAAQAEPGYGPPLEVTTGTVYRVADVAQLRRAVDAVNAGRVPATILLADATYLLDAPALRLACSGLVVRSQSGRREAVVVRGPDEGPSASVHHVFLVEADAVTIADLTLGWCRFHGIQIRGESPADVAGTRVHNCRLVNCNEQFIKGSCGDRDPVGATGGIIENCLFEFTSGWAYQYYTGGIDIHRGVNWIVRDNLFRSLRVPAGLPGMAEHAIHFWKRCPARPQDVVVERNRIVNCDRGIGFGLVNAEGGHRGGASIIRNNMIANDGAGARTDVGIGLEFADGVTVEHNSVHIPTYGAPVEYRFAGSSNVTFRNNLVNRPIRNRDGAPPAALSGNVETAEGAWYADAAAGDLHLAPAATGAIDRAAGGTRVDLDGDARPVLGGFDAGADEYAPAWTRYRPPALDAFDHGLTPSRVVHVAPHGSDSGGDGSPEKPFATPARALGLARAGTAVVLAPGTYAGGLFVADRSGAPGAPIWLRGADPARRPVLSGGANALHLSRVRYWVVENLEVQAASGNGINCDDGGDYANPEATRFIVFRNLLIHDVGGGGNQDGLKLSGVNDYWVLDSQFARCGGGGAGSGIDHVGCHRGVIARCAFDAMSGNAVQCKGGSEDIDIHACRMTDAGERGVNLGGSTGHAYFRPPLASGKSHAEARGIRVTACVFRGGVTPVAFVGSTDCIVANNTIVDPGKWFFRILQETVSSTSFTFAACARGAFVNNLVCFDRARIASADINIGPHTEAGTFFFARNLWYARDLPARSAPALPHAELGGLRGLDPRLADASGRAGALAAGSPAAGRGMPWSGLRRDADGRPCRNPPSVGAFEVWGQP